jgi:hypothetical protein
LEQSPPRELLLFALERVEVFSKPTAAYASRYRPSGDPPAHSGVLRPNPPADLCPITISHVSASIRGKSADELSLAHGRFEDRGRVARGRPVRAIDTARPESSAIPATSGGFHRRSVSDRAPNYLWSRSTA